MSPTPQCRQAKKTRSEVVLLWRNNIPIMIEVMLLPDCCYSDEGLATDGTDLSDPAIKQDALLLERWTLQPVPRQYVLSGLIYTVCQNQNHRCI